MPDKLFIRFDNVFSCSRDAETEECEVNRRFHRACIYRSVSRCHCFKQYVTLLIPFPIAPAYSTFVELNYALCDVLIGGHLFLADDQLFEKLNW